MVELFVILAILVCGGCLLPARYLPPLPNDKLLHGLAFFLLTLLATAIANGTGMLPLWLLALVGGGVLLEILQHYLVPDRHFCWRDIAANLAGSGCALLLWVIFPRESFSAMPPVF